MSAGAAALAAVLAGGGSLVAPRLIRAVPEPETDATAESPEGEQAVADGAPPVEAAQTPSPEVAPLATVEATPPVEPVKELYADIAALRGLAWKCGLAGAVSGAVIGWLLGWSWALLVLVPLVPVMVALSVIDWRTRLLPTWLIRPAYLMTVVLVLVASLLAGDLDALIRSGLGWLALGAFYFVLWFIYPRGLGYGDVRLSGILGLALGFVGWPELVAGAWCGFVLGGVIGGLLSLLRIVDRKGVPFGPFMVAGCLVGLALGPVFMAAQG